MSRIVAWCLATTLSLTACAGSGSSEPDGAVAQPTPASTSPAADEAPAEASVPRDPIRLVTLGDGYTYGFKTSAPNRDSWPSQLAEAMVRSGVEVLLWNLAEQSHTSDLVREEQLGQVASYEPDIVTLQVGVNDIIASDMGYYRENLETVFDELLSYLPAEHIFAITTPDHMLTGWGRSLPSADDDRAAVEALNQTLAEVAAARGIEVIDISAVNALASEDPSLVIDDGPYGTRKQYAGWVEIIGSRVRAAIEGSRP